MIGELKCETYCMGFAITEEALEDLPEIFQKQIREEWQKDGNVYFIYTEEYLQESREGIC